MNPPATATATNPADFVHHLQEEVDEFNAAQMGSGTPATQTVRNKAS